MSKVYKHHMLCFYFISFCFYYHCSAQEIPPIQVFTPQDYVAEDQNWSIGQTADNFIYVANNKGLLEYNGASWQLYNSPNDAILRTVSVVEDIIYSGGYMSFGYWTKNKQGKLFYTSLSDHESLSIKEDEDFWGIVGVEDYILFQSFDRIYIYNTIDKSFSIIDSDSRINRIFKVDDAIYFQKTGVGIFKIIKGQESLAIPSIAINNSELINIFDSDSGLLLQTKEQGFFRFQNATITPWKISADNLLSNFSVYSSIRLKDGSFVLGTIANGIIHLDANGNELLKINQSYGLSNNTVLAMKADSYGNIWLGLDNGINVVNLNSPYSVYTDKQGSLGTVYAAAKTNNFLYLGTNHGLFYKPIDSNAKFEFIEGTKGQVWMLSLLNGTLFCGHDKGTFVIESTDAKLISSELGTWTIKAIKGKPNLLIQGNYKGLNILEFVDNTWRFRNKIKGFGKSSRHVEFINSTELLVNHEHKGVYKIEVNQDFTNVLGYEKLAIKKSAKSSVSSYNDTVLYSSKEGVFAYDLQEQRFRKDSLLSELISGERYASGKLINGENKLWGFSNYDIIYLEPGKLSTTPKVNVIPISKVVRKMKTAYENVLELGNNKYLIGTTDGYLIINLNRMLPQAYDINLNSIDYGAHPNQLSPFQLSNAGEFENKTNNIQFKYSVTNYNKLSQSKYQYRLIGLYDDWSDWTTDSKTFYENLPYGDFIFEARALVGGQPSNNKIAFSFTIDKPWYIKPMAIISYVLLASLFIYVLYYFNKKHYKKEQIKLIRDKERQLELEQLENQRQLIQFENKSLQQDIDNKNRELGMATMNLVKRNELLSNIKSKLSESKSLGEVSKVIKLINSSINDTSDWELFEEAFNNVDKDFMKKIKILHPSITPNDLRLCAYLRLNLSSKEIAPLLNISHKSVEVKRYRLRKKMGLDHEQSLSNYIIEL
ncbi:triple tyrosine motif-containing protein [Winogradskyella vidalii]|uniref:triple tyrosine motif-containing protein n=1 Tax=Winogradskyella vidalii TaxID=2615024 RepID=UPI001FE86CBD|nr:triple tyrosine motif-containing protein [Winogradskyella vidalii]